MRPHTLHRCLTWLLPLLVLRAFVPAGFMPMWSGGELQMMLCSGAGAAPTLQSSSAGMHTSAHGHHEHHAHHGQHAAQGDTVAAHHGGDRPQAHDNSLCPFAAGGASGPAMLLTCSVEFAANVQSVRVNLDLELTSSPVSLDRIRGPPLV